MGIKFFWKAIKIKKISKPQYLCYLMAIIFFYIFRMEYLILWFFNITILNIFIPVFLVFLGLWFTILEHDQKSSKDSFLTSASIIFAILFFLIQGYIEDRDKLQAVVSIDNHNCIVARTNLSLRGKESTNFALTEFLIDDYKWNYGFLYNKMSRKFGDFYGRNLRRMESANSLIKITQSSLDPNNLQQHNKQIIEISQKIEKDMCNRKIIMFGSNMELNKVEDFSSTSTEM